jgi:hypothetical protein
MSVKFLPSPPLAWRQPQVVLRIELGGELQGLAERMSQALGAGSAKSGSVGSAIEAAPLALRLSGQLLLGLVRVGVTQHGHQMGGQIGRKCVF